MAYTYPGQMYDNTLTGLKGDANEHRLDITGSINASVNLGGVATPVPAGRCLHVTSLGTLTTATGVSTGPLDPSFAMGANLSAVAHFLWQNESDFDVNNRGVPAGVALGGTTTNLPAHIPIFPSQRVHCLTALGAYELETTEFDTTQTYNPNDFLRAVTRDTSADGGKLTNKAATASSGAGQELAASGSACVWGDPSVAAWDSIVGVVSRGSYTNVNGVKSLAFWPVYLPGTR